MNETTRLRPISTQDLMVLGMEHIAYVKPVETDAGTAYAVHTADGTRVVMMHSHALAVAAIRQHDLEPLSVH